jgi:oligosaccharyltransferase complex subunit beta
MKVSSKESALVVALLLSLVSAEVLPKREGIQTLVLLDDWSVVETHSIFFDSLKNDGHLIDFQMASPAPSIKYYEKYFYDNIILMAPSIKGNSFYKNQKLLF